ncbi:hypothetical protein CAOG_007704 [Capsaspora owczarzaki ATCC 30864]|uniref:NADH dehydrogenase [ubiquinone] 1 alpha subcomplex assembly factor 3 n=2 Tax=Capsaspora owczarzaki (strain ATCC 30864) TaxID=595528 RepID=A0A0D2WX21_CAPO3|nr:hypothetical protein CAOG_007704 [Capsaspora owczarzaki ATCC 30864]
MSTASAVDVLSHQDPSNPSVLIDSFSSMGFTVNGVTYVGSMALFPRVPLLWNVKSVEELTPESLTLFHLVNPKIELLLIGTGSKIETIDPAVRQMLKEKRISLEVLDTPHAATTFNFLSQEGRLVAAALIPIAPETPASTNP